MGGKRKKEEGDPRGKREAYGEGPQRNPTGATPATGYEGGPAGGRSPKSNRLNLVTPLSARTRLKKRRAVAETNPNPNPNATVLIISFNRTGNELLLISHLAVWHGPPFTESVYPLCCPVTIQFL
ncbi:hypothetical protein HNY73_019591 [Argiope bruennichi]|uniref:Uncharacterized protein n=1 Tax=Argiope bruennichi TaxID=94029 RepID=A0A8T0E5D1_ARGBR|nr:hypothetical protein HNY73_019591 [Argiope bruennichi]